MLKFVLIFTRFLYHYFPVNGLLLVLKQCFEQIACCFSDSVPLPSFPMLHRSTTLGRPPGPYYRKLVESIVAAVSFPDTLTISCIVLADRYWTKYAKCMLFSGNNHYCLTMKACVGVRDCLFPFCRPQVPKHLNRGLRLASLLWHAFTLANMCSALRRRSLNSHFYSLLLGTWL